MVLCSSRETVSLKIFKKLAGPPVYYSGSNEPSLAPFSNGWKITLKALTDHFEGGSRVYSFDPYW
jgi:hypothetical protein